MPHPKNICIFEDEFASNLFPLTLTRPVFELMCGAKTLAKRIQKFFPHSNIVYQCRDYLAPLLREQGHRVNDSAPGDCLFINGRVVMDKVLFQKIAADPDATLFKDDTTVAFRNSLSTKKESCEAQIIRHPWDLVQLNKTMIENDFDMGNQIHGKTHDGAHLIKRGLVCIGKNSHVKAGAVLDASDGPVIVGDNVSVMPNAVLTGPCYVGDNSIIKIGAKIYGGTTIGPVCKVGGEVEASIIHGYSNKQHDGFLGHSYIGEWCNLGADTNTSDLKNNYGHVKVTIDGKEIDSGLIFVGLTMGDHSKSAINTMFNTGTVVGVSSNIFGSGFPSKNIPSFAWANSAAVDEYQFEKALAVARTVMNRRHVTLSPAYEQMLKLVFEITKEERPH
jgi:UDP-N-acetylglucosamine diphosphorylase/glucosamine-1-phosphate N-acetyltransferase